MDDLKEFSHYFVLGSRFNQVAISFGVLRNGSKLYPSKKEHFGYLRDLIRYMANLDIPDKDPEMGLTATQLRPFFYQALLREGRKKEFSDRICQSLTSEDGRADLTNEELSAVERILLSISKECFYKANPNPGNI
jgi:hypothetical protein